jgi:crotonobetaine/carnitine-CoA ligase
MKVDSLELARHMADQLPYYMIPRYFELADELPKTPSMRVQKFELRARGNGPDTWDLTANGYKITRDGLMPA